MAGRQAKVLSADALRRVLAHADGTETPQRDRAIVLLSVKAGLRAGEIAKLTWPMVLDPEGQVADCIALRDGAAKMGSGRTVPMHPALKAALMELRFTTVGAGPVIRSGRGGAMRPNSIVNWFVAVYAMLGLEGCSSHSGRRTFITHAARAAHKAGASIRDVQMLAGHRSIETTQRYIDGDTAAQRRLVRLI
jgi:integrase/recombinase XerD